MLSNQKKVVIENLMANCGHLAQAAEGIQGNIRITESRGYVAADLPDADLQAEGWDLTLNDLIALKELNTALRNLLENEITTTGKTGWAILDIVRR